MHPPRLPILLLAAPFVLSACGGSPEQTVQIQRSSSARSVLPVAQTMYFAGLRSDTAHRVYQAAFGRTPDIAGLSYWITAMDNGASANAVAIQFVKSDEFKAVYGAASTNAEIVTRMYMHVLHRPGDPAGRFAQADE